MKAKSILDLFKKNWWVVALILIFLFSYQIRAFNLVPDKLLGFDPMFQYRYTKYLADWGRLPAWDELTYYVGRDANIGLIAPFMFYITTLLFWVFNPLFGFSLMTTASYASAIYGALIVIPAFLLGRELSNKYGGLLAAILIGTAPQILVRTFGGSYDTDQLALFFIILTLYLGFYALRKKTIAGVAFATTGFLAFMITWGTFSYTIFILVGFVIVNFALIALIGKKSLITKTEKVVVKPKLKEKLDFALKDLKGNVKVLVALFVAISSLGLLIGGNILRSLSTLIQFSQIAEAKIVNISIAELQPFNIFNLEGWIASTGNFLMGEGVLDIITFLLFVFFVLFALTYTVGKKDTYRASFILTLLFIGIYTTFRGIRFTEFTSALFLVIIAAGFGLLVEYSKRDTMLKVLVLGTGLWIAFIGAGIGMQMGQGLGPSSPKVWEDAWYFIKTQTPETSLIGTWWDPGHMIATQGERRNIADGAHCGSPCLYSINDRITDLGKIMATEDEKISIQLIQKYKGTSEKVYWIASNDLIGKFQWLQYFGTGCDARRDRRCPLYIMLGRGDILYDEKGLPGAIYYYQKDRKGNIVIKTLVFFGEIPFPLLIQGRDAIMFKEMIYYEGATAKTYNFEDLDEEKREALKPFVEQLNLRLSNETVPFTAWVPMNYAYLTLIPENQRNTVFTRMFFLEGQGLEHFKQVFRNEQVKVYEVIF
ncbi:MAG: STT3 domain-containing protein [Candidatus Aenigmatarchaeota archaeon]